MAFRSGEETAAGASSWAAQRFIAAPYTNTRIAVANTRRVRLTIIPNQSQAVYIAPLAASLPTATGTGAGQNGGTGAFALFREGGSPIILPLWIQGDVWACNDGVTGTQLDVSVIEEFAEG